MPRFLHQPLLAALWATLTLLSGGCSTNPATGAPQLNFISEEQEIQIGTESAPRFLQQMGGPLPDAQIRRYVSDIGRRLASTSERPELPWEFYVVDSAMLNAFALPGGKIFISRGLMARLSNEAQLAGVLAHEIAHITAQHINQQMTQSTLLSLGIQIVVEAAGSQWAGVLGGYGGKLYLLRFGRGQEIQSDELALRYLQAAGYDPEGMLGVLLVLKEASGGSGGLEMLQTHPLPQTRIDRTRRLLDERSDTRGRLGAETYRKTVLEPLRRLPPPRHRP
ncbi:MAG: M48 family metallopeptidase [Phycisphaeraceae bacterium]|nr:M48 family metallopeptidase [Phycisphaeraceae bacterium]